MATFGTMTPISPSGDNFSNDFQTKLDDAGAFEQARYALHREEVSFYLLLHVCIYADVKRISA